jgi:membrane protease YdiL (CAAX protease family)
MTDNDNLFKSDIKIKESNKESSIEEMFESSNRQKRNLKLFFVYILIQIVISFVVFGLISLQFPANANVLGSVEVVESISIEMKYDEQSNPIGATIYGKYVNNYSESIPALVVKVNFFNQADEGIGELSFTKYDFKPGEYFEIDSELTTDEYIAMTASSLSLDLSTNTYIYITFAQALVGAMLFMFIDRIDFKKDFIAFKKKPMKHIGLIFSGFALVLVALYASQYILEWLNAGDTSQNEMLIRSYFQKDPVILIILFFSLCVFTPIVEEVIYRKVIFNFIEPRLGSTIAILGTGFVFGLMHVLSFGDFIQSIPYVLLGLIFGYMYYISKKNIIVTIGMHFLNNLMTFLFYIGILYNLL